MNEVVDAKGQPVKKPVFYYRESKFIDSVGRIVITRERVTLEKSTAGTFCDEPPVFRGLASIMREGAPTMRMEFPFPATVVRLEEAFAQFDETAGAAFQDMLEKRKEEGRIVKSGAVPPKVFGKGKR